MDTHTTLHLLQGGVPVAGAGDIGGGGGGGGVPSGGSIFTMLKNNFNNHRNQKMSVEEEYSSPCPVSCDDDDLELGLGLSIGGGLKTKEEANSRTLTSQDFLDLKPSSSSSSSSSSSVKIPASSIVGTKRAAVHPVSPDTTSVIGWPPISKAHRVANRLKPDHLSVKVNMDGSLIGRKVDLYAHTSYESLAQTLDKMFYGIWSKEAVGWSGLLNGTSEYVLTYEDKDGDCMLVGDVPWRMFLSSVKRLRILRTPKMQH